MLSRAPPLPPPEQTFVFDRDNDKIKYYYQEKHPYCKHKVPLTHPRHLCGTLTVCMYTTRLNDTTRQESERHIGKVRCALR